MTDCPLDSTPLISSAVDDSAHPGQWPHPDDKEFRKGIKCFKCQREGHFASRCPERAVTYNAQGERKESKPHWNKWGRFKSKEKREEEALRQKLNFANFGHLECSGKGEELPQL